MIFTESWLRELIDFPVSIDELAEQLTMAGLEVESVTPCEAGFSGVIVSRVVAVEALPGSDKLSVCQVDTGIDGTVTVVCGASNVRAGQCYPLARPGASLPGGITINPVKKHGVLSDGMLCSAGELGLSEQAAGLFELPDNASSGVALDKYLGLPDIQVEVSLTPNRGDCLGMAGLAREVAVLNNLQFSLPASLPVNGVISDTRQVALNAGKACPRYCGRVIHGVDIHRKTPVQVSERLRRAGVRTINPVVDLANYVMLETGQPMHVFDNERLQGSVEVRFAVPGEKIVLLDGENRTLSENTLVIADQNGAVAMAGVMGGLHSAVNDHTRSIFIESAYFDPQAIMGRARQYGLHTDASHRYERGVDPELPALALEKLTGMILSVCGGQPGNIRQEVNVSDLPSARSIRLRMARVRRLLGAGLAEQRICTILERLGFRLEKEAGTDPVWTVHVPYYRFDVAIEADLIEEIARIYGYQNITGTSPLVKMQMKAADPYRSALEAASAALTARGYREAINYSFVDPAIQHLLGHEQGMAPRLLNPISVEMAEMRQSLWPGLLQSLVFNVKRQQPVIRLFETGKIYLGEGGQNEIRMIGGIAYGNKYKKQWDIKDKSSDFYDLKSDIEALLSSSGDSLSIEFSKLIHPALHPGQAATVLVNDVPAGVLGMLHPDIQHQLSLPQPAFLFQLEADRLFGNNIIKFNKLSKFPSVKRDISIVISEEITAASILATVKETASQPLINLELFDVYRGEGIDSGKKSLALGLTFQRSSSTLTDEEADAAVSDILQSLRQRFGALLRE